MPRGDGAVYASGVVKIFRSSVAVFVIASIGIVWSPLNEMKSTCAPAFFNVDASFFPCWKGSIESCVPCDMRTGSDDDDDDDDDEESPEDDQAAAACFGQCSGRYNAPEYITSAPNLLGLICKATFVASHDP
eukprot:CAMPEP_0167787916 /NCGR_PEP_ID=MMETSP0111_2-20121227/9713_1 /TAXON_ID=91324 /ORGANISM="Lotharella globosa, Strain CCCM811" /LENGTH=131 /DNA_ID=CAMNT_0007679661 /DNA_START=172 /DNA_END=564 /DNA_ORIENTATION=+